MAIEDDRIPVNGGDRRPVPDPTVLTADLVEKAITQGRAYVNARFDAVEHATTLRSGIVDREIGALSDRINSLPEDLRRDLANLQRLMEEKFKGVDQQFSGRDTALAAALLAQKTSVDEQNKSNAASSAKSEAAFTKLIDGIQTLIATASDGNDVKITALKDQMSALTKTSDDKINSLGGRLDRMDSLKEGSSTVWIALAAVFAVLASIAIVGSFILQARWH